LLTELGHEVIVANVRQLRVEEPIEKAVMEIALEKPAFGQLRVANELTTRGLFVSPTGVRSVWLRHDLETFRKRLKALEAKAAQEHTILTEEQLRALERAREKRSPRRGSKPCILATWEPRTPITSAPSRA